MASKVLIAGAGVAGLEAALALRELAAGLVDVELASPETDFVYRPLSVTAPFNAGEARRFPLHRLAEAAGASLIRAAVRSVDPERRMVVTSDGTALRYDALLVALGARPVASIPGALTFSGPGDEEAFSALLDEAKAGRIERLVFALPAGSSWPLPLYELALLTAVHLADAGASGVELSLVTTEDRPLKLFGAAASETVAELLEMHGIELRPETTAIAVEPRRLRVLPDEWIEADRVVALPRLEGMRLAGLPHDANGFVPTDAHGLVRGLGDVYAAGDLTDFPVKQGGIATQQADAAAESIAAAAGAPIEPLSLQAGPARPPPDGNEPPLPQSRGGKLPVRRPTPNPSGGRRPRSSAATSHPSSRRSCTCRRARRRTGTAWQSTSTSGHRFRRNPQREPRRP